MQSSKHDFVLSALKGVPETQEDSHIFGFVNGRFEEREVARKLEYAMVCRVTYPIQRNTSPSVRFS